MFFFILLESTATSQFQIRSIDCTKKKAVIDTVFSGCITICGAHFTGMNCSIHLCFFFFLAVGEASHVGLDDQKMREPQDV